MSKNGNQKYLRIQILLSCKEKGSNICGFQLNFSKTKAIKSVQNLFIYKLSLQTIKED